MLAPASNSDEEFSVLQLIPSSEKQQAVIHPIHHSLTSPISRIAISWSRGNSIRLSLLPQPSSNVRESDDSADGTVVEVKLDGGNGGIKDDAQWRRIVYGSVAPFAMFQSRKNSALALSKLSIGALADSEWYVGC